MNAPELRRELEYTGAIFQTTIDSEVIAYHIARERIKTATVQQAVANAMKKLVWEMNIATPAERGISREEFVSDATVEKVMLDPIWHFCPTEFNEDTARQLLGEVYDQKLY